MVKLHFHGHACWEITDGSHRVRIAPFLTDNAQADVGPEAFDELDAILLTHGHWDHIGDVVPIAERTKAQIISTLEMVNHFASKGCEGHPMHIGGGHSFPFGHVKLTIAHHSSSGPEGEALGNPVGLVLTMGGKKIYHAGDTGVFLDMQLIGELAGPLDAALLPIGDNFTMGIDEAVKATELLGARLNIPMHYDTFDLIKVDAGEFVRKVEQRGGRARVLRPGESLELA